MKLRENKLRDYADYVDFKAKVELVRDSLDLIAYYNRILDTLLNNNKKHVLLKNKDIILSNINNLEKAVADTKDLVNILE